MSKEDMDRIDELLRDHRKIDAIKLHRELFWTDLREAHNAIIVRERELGVCPKYQVQFNELVSTITIDGPKGRRSIAASKAYDLADPQ